VQEGVGGELEINTAEDILNLIREYPDSLAGDTSLHLGIHLYKEIAVQEETTKEQMTLGISSGGRYSHRRALRRLGIKKLRLTFWPSPTRSEAQSAGLLWQEETEPQLS
jgi:hypothetical protein